MKKFIFAAIATVMIPLSGVSQEIADGWKGIKVFKSTRADVEKAVGRKPTEKDGFRSTFVTDAAIVHVLFSGEPCSSEEPYTGSLIVKTSTLARAFNLPLDTVIKYEVYLKDSPLLTDLKLGKRPFRREVNAHMPQFVDYIADESEIVITTVALRDEPETLRSIRFELPAARERLRFACKEK